MVPSTLQTIRSVAVVNTTRIALSYLGVCVVAPVAVVVEGIAHIVVAGTVVVVPAPSFAYILLTDGLFII